MSCWEVKESLCRLVEPTQSEALTAMSLCRECFSEITAGLKADADTEDPRVTAASAALAFYKLMIKRNNETLSQDITSFKAGDVSISQGKNSLSGQLQKAEDYFRQCFSKLAPLCEDNSFAVTNVRIKVMQ